MAKPPLLSIITVNLNNLEGLKRTVDSVLSQTWKQFQFIVVDGNSTDGSAEFLKSKDAEIDKWISELDSGIYNAMNKGIAMASGEYLLFLNSGDHFFEDESLEKNYSYLKSYDFIYFDLEVVKGHGSFIKTYPVQLSFSYFLNDTLPHPATFIHRSIFNEFICYDESLKIVSDWKLFILGICKLNASYKHINNTITTFYLDGVSSHKENEELIGREKTAVLKNNFKLFLEDYSELKKLRESLAALRNSTITRLLLKIGLLKKF